MYVCICRMLYVSGMEVNKVIDSGLNARGSNLGCARLFTASTFIVAVRCVMYLTLLIWTIKLPGSDVSVPLHPHTHSPLLLLHGMVL
jgi:hypothetical protein